MATPLLGWIPPSERTNDQNDAHAKALANMPRFALPGYVDPPKGTKIMLSEFWKSQDVIDDTGLPLFTRTPFHQLTGSCVGAGGGNALFCLITVQRGVAEAPTKAIVPFWPFSYGRCRAREGDRGQGEGAMGSAFAEQVREEGVISVLEPGLTPFKQDDGLVLTSREELQWSDGNSSLVTKWIETSKAHPLGAAAEVSSPEQMKQGAVNGYPGTFACNYYIGGAHVLGSGADAAVVGKWDGRGGHQQFFFGYWDNPTLGPLYAVGNNWGGNTYPKDPAGLPLCSCWVKEVDVQRALGYDSEVYLFSHLNWFPAQPKVLDWTPTGGY